MVLIVLCVCVKADGTMNETAIPAVTKALEVQLCGPYYLHLGHELVVLYNCKRKGLVLSFRCDCLVVV